MWAVAVLAFTAAYLFVALFGSHECFEGTLMARAHYALTDGICDCVEDVARRVWGQRGVDCLASTEALCCQTANPVGQLFFLLLVAGCYWGAWHDIFPLLPVDGVASWHKFSGTAAALLVLALFLLVSVSDPGIITAGDLPAHLALYPPDGLLFELKDCTTCAHAKPARSKHCGITKACVARFDHYCLWVNNAVGLYNTRWFLAFLLATSIAAVYGAGVCTAVILGDMRRRGAWAMVWLDPRTKKLVGLRDRRALLVHHIVSQYGWGAGAAAFMALASWVVAGFSALQLVRVARGVTTNEAWKWKEVAAGLRAGAAAAAAATTPGTVRRQDERPPNPYDRGWRRNFGEVLMPRRHLALALSRSHKAH